MAFECIFLDLQSFRDALAMLQRQVDEVDELKAAHYHSISEHEEEVWDVVQSKVSQTRGGSGLHTISS